MSARAAYGVVVAGGGIAGAEALLAVRELAGDLVALTLVEPRGELRLHALEPGAAFAIGDAGRLRIADIALAARAVVVRSALAHVDVEGKSVRTREGERLHYDALLVAVGSSAVLSLHGAMSWLPGAGHRGFPQLLADAETGRLRRAAFLVPTRCAWHRPRQHLAAARHLQCAGCRLRQPRAAVAASYAGRSRRQKRCRSCPQRRCGTAALAAPSALRLALGP